MGSGNNTNSKLPKPIGPYSVYRQVGNIYYFSGQIALNQDNVMVNATFTDEVHQVMKNIKTILNDLDLDFAQIVQTTIYLKDLNNFQEFNTIYASYFADSLYPSRATVEVSKLPKNANVEISFIVAK